MGFGQLPPQMGRAIEPATQSDREDTMLTNIENQNSDFLTYGIPALMSGIIDEVGQSVGLIDEGDVVNALTSINEGAGNFYKQNQEGSKIAGAVATAFVPILKLPKLLKSGALIDRVMSGTPLIKKLKPFVITSGNSRSDRIQNLSQELKTFVGNKGVDITQDTNLLKAIRAEKLGAAADTIKENAAIDLAIYGLLNESELFFPSDSTLTNLAMYTIPTALFGAGSFLFTGRAIMRHISAVDGLADELQKSINPLGIKNTDVLSRRGNRGVPIAISSVTYNQAAMDIANATSTNARSNAIGRQGIATEQIQNEVTKLGNDIFYEKGIDGKFDISSTTGESKTAVAAFIQEPSLSVSASSLNPVTPRSQISIPKERNIRLAAYDVDINKLQIKLDKFEADLPEGMRNLKTKQQDKLDELVAKKRELSNATMSTIETDGSLVPLTERKFSILDTPDEVVTTRLREGMDLSVDNARKIKQEMAFTNQGAFLLSQKEIKLDDGIIHGIDSEGLLPSGKLNETSLEYAKAGVADIALNFSAATPRGNSFIDGLPSRLTKFMDNPELLANASSKELKELQELFTASGLQKDLRQFTNEEGFLQLGKDAKPVHVDDVIGMIKGKLYTKPLAKNVPASIDKLKLFQAQNFEQRTTAWVLAQRFADQYNPATAEQLLMSDNRTFLELDMAIAIMKKNPGEELDLIKWSPKPELKGQSLINEMEFVSLMKKQQEYSKLRIAQTASKRGIIKFSEDNLANDYTIATMLNLPNPTGVGKHPIMELFDGITPQVGGAIPPLTSIAKNIDELKLQMAGMVNPGALQEGRQLIDDFSFNGNSLRFDKDKAKKPVIMMSTNRSTNRTSPDELNALVQSEKLNLYSKLSEAASLDAPLTGLIWESLRSNPELFALATRVDKLIQGTQAGRNIISSRNFANRDNDVLQAMDLLQDFTGKLSLKYINDIFAPSTNTFSRLASHGNEGSLISLNQGINELRNGWDVLADTVAIADSKVVLALDAKSARNQEMYKQFFGRSLKDDLAASANGYIAMPVRSSVKEGSGIAPTPAVLDQLALDGLTAITDLSHKFLGELNFLRSVRGLNPINKRNWHVPYYDLTNKSILHITDLEGKTVNIVSAATEGEARRIADQRAKVFTDNGTMVSVQTEDFTKRHVINSGGQFEAPTVNFGMSGKQTGGIKGRSATPQVNIGIDIMQDSIKQLQNNFASIQKYTTATAFESELSYVRSSASAMPSSALAKAAKTTVFATYEQIAMQTGGLTEKTGIGKLYYGVEGAADMLIGKLWDKYHDFIPSTTRASMGEFEKFNKAVGSNYNPYDDFATFLEKTNKVKIPATFRGVQSKMNGLATSLILRIFDPGMPVINFASVAAVTPAVIRALQRLPSEGLDAWKRRIGIVGSPISDTDAIPNTLRIGASAIHGFFDPEIRAAIKSFKNQGVFKQEVAEKIELITSPIEGYAKRMTSNAIKWLSKPTDWSEEMSRQISFSMFYTIGKRTMGLDGKSAALFAHKRANDIVGDYRASNRPQIFQGATGMPFGLFTTWVWNFLQRFYGDIEGGRLGAASIQAGTNFFLFGAESTPGYEPAINMFTTSYDGKTNIVDTLDRAFGSDAIDFVASGTLANIPKLFGAKDGISIGSRGSVTVPSLFQPTSSLEDIIPSLRTTKTLVQGFGMAVESMRANSGVNGRELAEIVSTNAVNGALKNIAQIGLGYSVDKSGQLVNADTRRNMDLLARGFELRTLNEVRKYKEMARDRLQQEQKAEQNRRMNKRLRSAMRGDGITSEVFEEIGEEHFLRGGTRAGLKNRLRQAAIVGQLEVTDRKLIEAARRSDDEGKIMRLRRLSDDSTE